MLNTLSIDWQVCIFEITTLQRGSFMLYKEIYVRHTIKLGRLSPMCLSTKDLLAGA